MLFDKVLVENKIQSSPQVKHILKGLKRDQYDVIERYDEYFGKYKKPYLQKRTHLNLFLAEKKGQLVKEAPPAYGSHGDPHYYFIHAYNCIYECEYCYLQGYFSSPDIVLFVNYEEIQKEIISTAQNHKPGLRPWFHAGEFSDSLALSHITGECDFYWDTFKKIPNALLELRTKSANISAIKKMPPLENIIISFSLSPEQQIKTLDRKTATYNQRLKAIKTLADLGHPIGIHFDPIISTDNYIDTYEVLLDDLSRHIDLQKLKYLSLGVVRFTKDCYRDLEKNYPQSRLLDQEYVRSFDNKVRYSRPHRMNILKSIEKLSLLKGVPESGIYLCME